ncbi:MAG: heavy metal-binding domain-containing protein, partial [Melioribacteraceae bacterium]|nr:heavy metal-binding domain-containing protein [Melioribacteraceae bacterium]
KKAKSHNCTENCDHSKEVDSTEMHSGHSHMMDHGTDKADVKSSEPIIYEGKIDVPSIDKNQDNFVFECPMDWNVISDKAGNCPTCGMKLKKYSVEETKKNLVKYGYKLK